jgi:hypothetical protein
MCQCGCRCHRWMRCPASAASAHAACRHTSQLTSRHQCVACSLLVAGMHRLAWTQMRSRPPTPSRPRRAQALTPSLRPGKVCPAEARVFGPPRRTPAARGGATQAQHRRAKSRPVRRPARVRHWMRAVLRPAMPTARVQSRAPAMCSKEHGGCTRAVCAAAAAEAKRPAQSRG